jgi:ABC-type dipeptide/oligopeptide/nickel transport system permease component
MIPFIIRRLLWMVVLLLVISFLTFIIFYTLHFRRCFTYLIK